MVLRLARLHAIICKMDADAAVIIAQKEKAQAQKRGAEQADLLRRAMPESEEVEALKTTIRTAAEAERRLAGLFDAFVAHRKAQSARVRISNLFEDALRARGTLSALGTKVRVVPLPKRPQLVEAPAGAIAFANAIERVLSAQRE